MITFKVINRGKPGENNGKEKKYYAAIEYTGKVETDAIIRFIENSCSVNEADLVAVLYAIKIALINYLQTGHIVKLEAIGTFYPVIHSKGSQKLKDVRTSNIKKLTINYRPDPKLLEEIEQLVSYSKSTR